MKATKLKRIGSVLLFSLLFVGAAIFYGWPLLNMFGVVKYDPVMSQSSDQIVRVELFEGNGEEYSLRASISGDVLPLFLEDFMEIEFRRYVSHPPASQGKRVIKISYVDGGYDLVGDIVDFFDSDGKEIPIRGWYYMPSDDVQYIFEKFGSDVTIKTE